MRLVDKDKVEKVERWVERMALDGKLRTQLTENDVITILSKQGEAGSITFARKKRVDDDDDDDDSDLR